MQNGTDIPMKIMDQKEYPRNGFSNNDIMIDEPDSALKFDRKSKILLETPDEENESEEETKSKTEDDFQPSPKMNTLVGFLRFEINLMILFFG